MGTSKTVLIVGGSGFVGTHLALSLRDHYKIFATCHTRSIRIPGVTFLPMMAEKREYVRRVISRLRPDVIIYVAGAYPLELNEETTQKLERLYVIGAASVINASLSVQPKFMFISNSYVFDGLRGNYLEDDVPVPGKQIGRLKIAGENVVKSKCFNYMILRTSPLIGRGNGIHPSFLDTLRMNLDREEPLACSTHELHSFAPIAGFCELVHSLIEAGPRNKIFHYGGLTKLTQFEFARQFAQRFHYNENLIYPKAPHKPRLHPSSIQKTSNEGVLIRKMQRKVLTVDPIYDYSLNSTQTVQSLKIKPLLLQESFDLIEKQLIPHF